MEKVKFRTCRVDNSRNSTSAIIITTMEEGGKHPSFRTLLWHPAYVSLKDPSKPQYREPGLPNNWAVRNSFRPSRLMPSDPTLKIIPLRRVWIGNIGRSKSANITEQAKALWTTRRKTHWKRVFCGGLKHQWKATASNWVRKIYWNNWPVNTLMVDV